MASRFPAFPLALLAMLGFGGCDESAHAPAPSASASAPSAPRAASPPALPGVSWPALPKTRADADRVIQENTVAKPQPIADAGVFGESPDSWTVAEIIALMRQRQLEGRLIAGWRPITGWFQKRLDAAAARKHDGYLLLGTYHDAAAQLNAFRRLLGSLERLNAAPVEHFQADGHWVAELNASVQQGDSRELDEFLRTGSSTSYSRLLVGRSDHNYAVWKFGLTRELMDLAVESRARQLPIAPCDMPSELQKVLSRRFGSDTGDALMRLRELHCFWTLRDELRDTPKPWRVAMLWGQAHVVRDGLPRFLPKEAEVVRVHTLGDRFDPEFGIESKLAKQLSLTDPVLIPIDAERVLLLLPGRDLGARIEKKREDMLAGVSALRVLSTQPGTLLVDRQTHAISGKPAEIHPPAGTGSFAFETPKSLLIGAYSLPRGGEVDLELDPPKRSVLMTLRLPE